MSTTRPILITGGTVVPMTGARTWHSGDLLLQDGRVAAVGTVTAPEDCDRIEADGCLVLPGFVQAHVHVVQSLARCRADGLELLDWLKNRIWPYEAAVTTPEVRSAAELGLAELLCGGTTSALDMGTTHDQDQVFEAAEAMGIRLTSGKCHMDTGVGVPAELLEDTEASLAEAERLGRRWHGAADGRLSYAVSPRFVLSCTRELLAGCAELARRRGWLLHSHASENAEENRQVRTATGRSSVAALADVGIRGDRTVLAHCVHLSDDEVSLLASDRTAVAHCPGANLKLASGIADLPRLLRAAVRLGIGADGPPCNNRLSVFHEMALAGTLHNLAHGAHAVDAWTVLELATWRGADAIGLRGVGRLLPGWHADVVVIDAGAWSMQPPADPAGMIVFGGEAGMVRDVMVAGRPVVRDRVLLTANACTIKAEASAAATAVAARLGWS